jgi:hypothetical protein
MQRTNLSTRSAQERDVGSFRCRALLAHLIGYADTEADEAESARHEGMQFSTLPVRKQVNAMKSIEDVKTNLSESATQGCRHRYVSSGPWLKEISLFGRLC